MWPDDRFLKETATMRRAMRSILAGGLCTLLVGQPLLAAPIDPESPATSAPKQPAGGRLIQGDERILHALNRLTFGPRPGDVQNVRSIGLERWIDLQLHPEKIPDAALDARLAAFPAMSLNQADLMRRFPGPQMLRQISEHKAAMPSDATDRIVTKDALAFYEMARARREAAQAATGGSSNDGSTSMAAGTSSKNSGKRGKKRMGDEIAAMPPEDGEERLYSDLEAMKVVNLPPDQRMQRILAMSPEELIRFRRSLKPADLAAVAEGLNPQQRETLGALQSPSRVVVDELLQMRMMRDIYSERQLEAVMTDFWLNHFNVYLKKNQVEPYLLSSYERDVIRPHAMGRFEDLLVATATSPAMMLYLDNAQSVGPRSLAADRIARFGGGKGAKAQRGLNENYARELMELHTLGVNGGYTQADVTQVAKVFTGWTIAQPAQGARFEFDERRHEPGSKTVLGVTIREAGPQEGLTVLHMLATSPATAKFISRKLAVRFVSDTPPQALVDRMTKTFLATGGDIRSVLRTMFHSPEFWSPEMYRAKVKTPLEFVVSTARASGAEVTNAQPLVATLDRLGMPLYGMQTPNGYSWTQDAWVNTGALVNRMNFAVVFSNDRLNGVQTDWNSILMDHGSANPMESAEAKERVLEALLIGEHVSDRTRQTVLAQTDDPDSGQGIALPKDRRARVMVLNTSAREPQVPVDHEAATIAGLLLGSPEFQRR